MNGYVNPNDIAELLKSVIEAEAKIAKSVAVSGLDSAKIKDTHDKLILISQSFDSIITCVSRLNDIISVMDKINDKSLKRTVRMLPRAVKMMNKMVIGMMKLGAESVLLKTLKPAIDFSLTYIIKQSKSIADALNAIASIKIGKTMLNTVMLIPALYLLKNMMKMLATISVTVTIAEMQLVGKILLEFKFAATTLKEIFETIKGTPTLLITAKLRSITNALRVIRVMLRQLRHINVGPKVLFKMTELLMVTVMLKDAIIALTLTALVAVPFLLLAPVLLLAILATALVMLALKLIPTGKDMFKKLAALILLGAALLLFTTSLVLISIASALIDLKGIGILMLVIVGLTLMTALLGLMFNYIVKGSIALVILSIAIATLAISMLLFGVAAQLWSGLSMQDIMNIILFIGGVAVIAVVAGLASAFIIAGAAALIVLGVAMLTLVLPLVAIAGVIKLLESVDVETGVANMKTMITGFIDAVTSIFDGKGIGGSLKLMAKLTAATAVFAELFIIAGSIAMMATLISGVANMTMAETDEKGRLTGKKVKMSDDDFKRATDNIAMMMTTILNAMGSDEMTETLNNLDAGAAINIALILSACSNVSGLFDAIKTATNFKTETITDGIGKVKFAISEYINALYSLFVEESHLETKWGEVFGVKIPYFERVVDKEAIISEDQLKDISEKMTLLGQVTTPINDLIDAMKNISENAEKADANSVAIGDVIRNAVSPIFSEDTGVGGIKLDKNASKKVDLFKDLVEHTSDLAKIDVKDLKENTDSFIRLIDKANTIDTTKISTVRDMMREMKEFSESIEGDFEELADVLNDKLVDILADISETMKNATKNANPAAQAGTSAAQSETLGKSFAEDNKSQQTMDLSTIENKLEELVSSINYIKTNGLHTKNSMF